MHSTSLPASAIGPAKASVEVLCNETSTTAARLGFMAMPWIALRRISWLRPIILRPNRSVTRQVPRTFSVIFRASPLLLSISEMMPTRFLTPTLPSPRR